MDLQTQQYSAQEAEKRWYQYWQDKGYFRSIPDEREPYTIVIPPPNVTGILHMGHMLNNTIQDVLIRRARLQGKNACWVPGTDHASIATEAKVVKLLREQGLKKGDIGREKFLEHAFAWKDKYGGIILDQLKMLGASCDWARTRFTMEPSLSKAVIKVFVDLYQKGYLYRGLRMTNWDPEAKTVLSGEEVIYSEEQSQLYHVRYRLDGPEEDWITIATTRPETILADTGLAVNPNDERYAHLRGRQVYVPLVNRLVPIIFDDYVDPEFGTGALKVTPAHDTNDYELGQRYNLEVIDIFNEDGTLNEKGGIYQGLDRFRVRKQIAKDLDAAGHLVKTEDYKNKVGRSERSNAVVEPRLTEQWFVRMGDFAREALRRVEDGEIRFVPESFINMYRTWLGEDNIRDWCISRQLWWGQQIPAYYTPDGKMAVAETKEEALAQLNAQGGSYQLEDLRQDEDAVDTWFSSWLWPISVFDAFENPEEFRYYYPTNVLVTGWDIMFFWVARMIMAGNEWAAELLGEKLSAQKGIVPFRDVYFTGMVRDNKRRKMSKSLGNSPDSIALIEKYGADGVRFGILSCSAAGNDVIFDAPFDPETKEILNESKLCEQGRNFSNKLWNALRLLKGWEVVEEAETAEIASVNALALRWMQNRLDQVRQQLEEKFADYRLSEALMMLYNFIWDDFCAWYLEIIKPAYGSPIDRPTLEGSIALFEQMMTLLHPFMPFITEEVWSQLRPRAEGEDCVVSRYQVPQAFDSELLKRIETFKDIVSKLRKIRNEKQLSPKALLRVYVRNNASAQAFWAEPALLAMFQKIAFTEPLLWVEDEPADSLSFIAATEQYYVWFEQELDVEAEREKLEKEIAYLQGFIEIAEKKLSNERFVQNAKPEVVENERKKLADGQARLALALASLAKM